MDLSPVTYWNGKREHPRRECAALHPIGSNGEDSTILGRSAFADVKSASTCSRFIDRSADANPQQAADRAPTAATRTACELPGFPYYPYSALTRTDS